MRLIPLLLFLHVFIFHRTYALKGRKVLVIIFNGLSSSYLENENVAKAAEPLNKLCARSTKVVPVCPANFVTNAFSIATGVESKVHGVMGENVYDTTTRTELNWLMPDMYKVSRAAIPIWITNQFKNGHSGCMMYPGGEFEYGEDARCQYVKQINEKIGYKKRFEKALEWLKFSRTNLVMMSVDEPLKIARELGPNHEGTLLAVEQIFAFINKSIDVIKEKGLSKLNVIYVGTHGVGRGKKKIELESVVSDVKFTVHGSNGMVNVVPVDGPSKEPELLEKLVKESNEEFKVFRTDTLPVQWRCDSPARTGPIIAVANKGNYFQLKSDSGGSDKDEVAVDGYDIDNPETRTLIYGWGPDFRENYEGGIFSTKDIYYLISKLLDVNPVNPIDKDNAEKILKLLLKERDLSENVGKIIDIVASAVASVIFIVLMVLSALGWRRISNKRDDAISEN